MFFDAEKLDNKKVRKICKILFIVGFFFMPVMWMMLIWFCFTYVSPTVSYRNKYIIASSVLLIVDFVLLMTWNLIYQKNWFNWGAFGDYVSVNQFKGQL